MPPKEKKDDYAKKMGGDDDEESALTEVAPTNEGAAEEAHPPSPPSVETIPSVEDAGAAPPVDAAAAFLASMGVAKGATEKKDNKKDKKKKGKPKKDSGGGGGGGDEDEDNDEKASADKPTGKSKPVSAAAKAAAARLAATQAEEEQLRKLQQEADALVAEEERKVKEEADKAEADKAAKKKKAEDKIAAAKAAGTYLTKAQKEKAKLASARLEAMKASGMVSTADGGGQGDKPKKGKVVYGNKKKGGNGKDSKAKEEATAAALPSAPESAADTAADTAAAATALVEKPEEEKKPQAEEEEGGNWDDGGDNDALDDWESGDIVVPTLDLGTSSAGGGAAEEWEDLAEKERLEEEAKVVEAAERRKLKAQETEAAKVTKEAAKKAMAESDAAAAAAKDKANKKGGGGGGGRGKKAAEESQAEAEHAAEGSITATRAPLSEAAQEARLARRAKEALGEATRSVEALRSPIVCIMGHVDTGKTKLLDKIRRTNVQDGEAGGITQQIGATFFPGTTLHEKTHKLNALLGMELKLPGMLVIDTPGHEAFSNLRNRGSSLCDIAILVIDLMHGLEQQTLESIEMLRAKRCPFVVALNKVDRCYGWKEQPDLEFRDALAAQEPATQEEFHHRMKGVRVQLMEKGLNAELYWENEELGSTVSLVPTSAISGEGVNDLLHMLSRLSQQHLAKKLSFSPNLQCTVLEVKVIDGLGCTIDVILVNGELDNGATIVVCTTEGPLVTTVRALLTPPPNRELRIKSQYVHNDKLKGAVGIKICAVGLENAVAGSPVLVVHNKDSAGEVEELKDECVADFANLAGALATDSEGVLAVASTLGALEALLVFLRNECKPPIPVAAVSVGPIFKKEVMRAALMHDKKKPEYATILAFDVDINDDAREYADANKVTIFTADIIYHLFDQFTAYRNKALEDEKEALRDTAVFPCLLQIMPRMVFNQKDPIICGVEVLDGVVKVGTPLCIPKNGFLVVGRVASIEIDNKKSDKASKGQQCAISIVNEGNPGMTYGRQFTDEHALYSELSRASIDALKKVFKDEMTDDNWRLVIKLKKIFGII